MEKEVLAYIRRNKMIEKGDIVLAGVSGGSDSMAMLRILKQLQQELGITLRVVHVHHGIRGQEADRDSTFVEKMCREWEIPCTVYYYDVPGLSREWKLGEEETGRLVRKEAFQKEISHIQDQWKPAENKTEDQTESSADIESSIKHTVAVKIALAHNQEDLAETMIHNLCRGTGLRGLCTMRPVAGEIIRPILCLSREKVAEYLSINGIRHIQDSTNLSDEYTRNRIRHHILPVLEQEVNKKAAEHMVETAERIFQAEEYLTQQSAAILELFQTEEGYCFSDEFFEQPKIIQTYALQQAMEKLAGRRRDLTAIHYEKVLELYEMQTGRRISLPYQMEARRTYGGVVLFCRRESTDGNVMQETRKKGRHSIQEQQKNKTEAIMAGEEWELSIPGTAICPLGEFSAEIFSYEGQKIEEKKYTKWLDYDRIEKNPCIRTRKTGDYLVINAQGNTKKLNRCMIDEKIPAEKRDAVPLIACGEEILWMVGGRMNERYKINPQTRKVLVLNYQGGHKNE